MKINELSDMQFPQPDSDVTVCLTLDGKEYELSQFSISFGQSTDHKGQPQNEVRGGQMLVTISQTVPDSIYAWAMKSTTKSGVVAFKIKTGSSPIKIEFENAYCVKFNRIVDTCGGGVESALVIAPEAISINGVSFDNRWN